MSSQQGHIAIGPEFFAKIKNDYADWRWALIREFLQNCFDAPGCKNVVVNIEAVGSNTILLVYNDGEPMDQQTLTTKLLTLGGSGKNFTGENTGGFGVAKSLLYYCHKSYEIRTGNITVVGSGASYTIAGQSDKSLNGTCSTVTIAGASEVSRLSDAVRSFAACAQWKGSLTLNGDTLTTNLHKGTRRKDLRWGIVYTNNSFTNLCIVRLNGQPMFRQYSRYKGCVLIELTGKANTTLTSNRDGLIGSYASDLSDFMTSLAIDKRSALREQKAEYKRYQGELQRNDAKKPVEAEQGLSSIINVGEIMQMSAQSPCGGEPQQQQQMPTPSTATGGGIKIVVQSKEDELDTTISIGPQFILKNTTGIKTPAYYLPGKHFSKYSRELIRSWTALLVKLHQLCNRSGEFSVGFVFDEENEAECEQGIYGRVYYINPVRVVTTPRRTMSARFTSAWHDRFDLISVACHEFVHGAYGLGQHDEDYAGQLTEVMTVALRHYEELIDLCRPALSPTARTVAPAIKPVSFTRK